MRMEWLRLAIEQVWVGGVKNEPFGFECQSKLQETKGDESFANDRSFCVAEAMEGLGHVIIADAEEAEAAFDAFDDGALVLADGVDGSGELHDLSVKLARALEVLRGGGLIHLDVEFGMQIGPTIDAAMTAE